MNVTCKLVKKGGAITGTKCKATIVRTTSRSRARVALRLYRGAKVYAMGSTVLKKRSGSFGLVQRRKLSRGARYDMSIVLTEKKGTVKNAVGRVQRSLDAGDPRSGARGSASRAPGSSLAEIPGFGWRVPNLLGARPGCGYASIWFLLRFLRTHSTGIFIGYRMLVGGLIICALVTGYLTADLS